MAVTGTTTPPAPERVRTKRAWELLVLGLIVAVVWFFASEQTIKFREEVQLANGKVIEVERELRGERMGEIGGPGGWVAKYSGLRILGPKGAVPPAWVSDAGLIPLLLESSPNGEWRLVVTFYTCDAWYALGKPQLPYVEFRTAGNQWEQERLAAELIGREANLLTRIDYSGEPARVTRDEKRARMNDPKIAPRFLRVVSHWDGHC